MRESLFGHLLEHCLFFKKNQKNSLGSLLLSLLEGSVSRRAEQFSKKKNKEPKQILCDDILQKIKNNIIISRSIIETKTTKLRSHSIDCCCPWRWSSQTGRGLMVVVSRGSWETTGRLCDGGDHIHRTFRKDLVAPHLTC